MKLVGMKIILFWYELHTIVFAVHPARYVGLYRPSIILRALQAMLYTQGFVGLALHVGLHVQALHYTEGL